MPSPLFHLPSNPEISKKLEAKVRSELLLHKKESKTIEKAMKVRFKALSLSGFFRLRLLHREFTGQTVPGLHLFVKSARCAHSLFKQLKSLKPNVWGVG